MITVLLYALGTYITSTVTREMKNFVPVTVWNQWAQERGEWRGKVDQRLDTLEKEMAQQRSDIQGKLSELDKKTDIQGAVLNTKLDAQTSILNEVKDSLKQHMQQPKSP